MAPVLDLKRLERTDLFPNTLIKYSWANSDDLNQDLIELILAKEKEDPGIFTTNVGGWHSKKDLQNWEGQCVQLLLDRIRSLGAAMLESLVGQTIDIEHWTVQAWANINRLENCNKFHHHVRNSNLLSGVYYVSTGIEVTDHAAPAGIMFVDQYRPTARDRKEWIDAHYVRPEPGLMLLFPSSLAHQVECHRGAGNRVSVAFNLKNGNFTTINYDLEESKTVSQRRSDSTEPSAY
jgi:uncharacterized protein (TIGR02466 family)